MRLTTLALIACLTPAIAFAAGSGSDTPPKSTKTSQSCKAGEIYDEKTKTCLDKSSALIDDDTRYEAVRELAYAALYDRASGVLDVMDPADSRVLTYRGFIARKTGDMQAAMTYYAAALEANADNLLARSYMGQGLVEAGDRAGAKLQLTEIRQRGGRNTWAELSLRRAITTGVGATY
jgi:tetratricopeptide (TPR) repeat protein